MSSGSLNHSLEAYKAYYARLFVPAHSAPEQVREEKRQTILRLYEEVMADELCLQALEARFGHKFDPSQPRIPAGQHGGGQWTDGGGGFGGIRNQDFLIGDDGNDDIDPHVMMPGFHTVMDDSGRVFHVAPKSWNNPRTLGRKYTTHGLTDFDAKSPKDYVEQANRFYQRFQKEGLPAIKYPTGEIGVYDPKTNSFGIYTPNGKTITFYKPTSPTYFQRQIEMQIPRGARIINPIPIERPILPEIFIPE